MEKQGRSGIPVDGCRHEGLYHAGQFMFAFAYTIVDHPFTFKHGVTSTNALVDVVKFFSDHVFQDLQAELGTVHPILQVDAIRFLYTFRNQVNHVSLHPRTISDQLIYPPKLS